MANLVSNLSMKLVVVVPWLRVLHIMMLLGDTLASDNINLGAIFTLDTINGQVSQIAMKAAVDDINSDPNVLGARNLSLQIHDSNYNGFLSIMGALQFMETDTVAIIGPQSSIMAHVLSHLANELHIPLLSFTALDPTLSPIQYPYFFQTAPNDLFQMAAIAEIVSYYRWTQVVAIFTDEESSRNGITALGDKLTEKRARISYKAVLPPDIRNNESVVKQELEKVKMMESRVLVVHTLAAYGEIIVKMAEQLGMLGDGYVWIATAWLPSILDYNHSSDVYKRTQGVITLRQHIPDSPRKKAFISRWIKLSQGSVGLNAYGFYAYDTVWLIARAINAYLRQGHNISFSNDPVLSSVGGGTMNLSALSIFDGGSVLLKNILETHMTGLTGPTRYDSERNIVDPSYDVLNIVGSQMRGIGYWSNYSGLSVLEPEILRKRTQNRSSASQKLYSVVWPGGTKKKPLGWTFRRDGRKLQIGVPHRVSFLEFVYKDNQTHAIRGNCIDVFEAAVKLLPYPVQYEFILFGDGHRNPSYSELVRRITTGEFDGVVGDIAIVTNRTMIADFTQPYADSGLVVVAPVKKLASSAWAFLRPFTPLMWVVTAIFFLIVGAVIWILEHRLNDEFRGPPRQQIMTILWFSFSTLFFAHRENTVSTLGRLVLVIWLFVVLIIQSSYTASLTSFLTVQQLTSSIKGIDSLITGSAPIGFQVGSYAENYLNEELNIPKSRLKPLASPEDYANALSTGRVAAVVDEQPYIDLFLSNYCQYAIAGQEFTKSGWGFAFKSDSPLALDMSTAILQLSENGSLQNITERWLKSKRSCQSKQSVNDSEQLKLDNFTGLFLISGVACLFALIVYFCLTLYKFHQHLPDESEPSSQSSSRSIRLKTFLSFADRKEDLSQRRVKKKRMSASMPV
ncbi:glutamate receptor 3.2-like isoform X2 [Amaranthus tricolor]|uniref:glutamate receptor 3.2-like isoform X2 n=1 Tax=Amaranthus tricolor TaxID=29722 RepID=UPI0025882DD1|nr:glutamate receptor 3.2-like isoform X2 [Amaranthus tricolor]XP_057525857.1 glutamate receptor 3.2-like isoform X2 [Amaranthus tricolor]XP_057525858.1 glutamate receptor 3.2-like isoform X2 [Amaranthus tricolor]